MPKRLKLHRTDDNQNYYTCVIQDDAVERANNQGTLKEVYQNLRNLNVPFSSDDSVPIDLSLDENQNIRVCVPPTEPDVMMTEDENVTAGVGGLTATDMGAAGLGNFALADSRAEIDSLLESPDTGLEIGQCSTSCRVKFSKIPAEQFNLMFFKFFLKTTLGKFSKDLKAVKSIDEFRNGCIIVEFENPETASQLVKLDDISYKNIKVCVELMNNETAPITGVKISNFPDDFELSFFQFFLEDLLTTYEVAKNGLASVKKINNFNELDKSIIVEFTDLEVAQLFSNIPDPTYLDQILTFQLVSNEQSNNSLPSLCVQIRDVPVHQFNAEFFEFYLNQMLLKYDVAKDGLASIKHFEYDEFDSSVTVEFRDPVTAKLFSNIQPMFWIEHRVNFKLVNKQQHIQHTINTAPSPSVTAHKDSDVLFELKKGPNGDWVLPAGQTMRTDWPHLETLIFIKALLLSKLNINVNIQKNTKVQGHAWTNTTGYMWERGYFYSTRQLKNKLKGLMGTYQQNVKTWLYHQYMDQFESTEITDFGPLDNEIIAAKNVKSQVPAGDKGKLLCGVVVPGGNINASEDRDGDQCPERRGRKRLDAIKRRSPNASSSDTKISIGASMSKEMKRFNDMMAERLQREKNNFIE